MFISVQAFIICDNFMDKSNPLFYERIYYNITYKLFIQIVLRVCVCVCVRITRKKIKDIKEIMLLKIQKNQYCHFDALYLKTSRLSKFLVIKFPMKSFQNHTSDANTVKVSATLSSQSRRFPSKSFPWESNQSYKR